MNTYFYPLFFLIIFVATGCSPQSVTVKKPVMFASLEEFKQGPDGGVDLVWSTARISDAESLKGTLQKYDSLMLGQTWIVADKESAHRLNDEQILATSRRMIHAILARLGLEFKIVEIPTDTTLLLSIALTNVEISLPVLAATSRLLPERSGSSALSTIIVDGQVPAGHIAVELLVCDAQTREPLVAVIDTLFEDNNLAALIHEQQRGDEAISQWADRLWTTLRDWNWIKSRPDS